MSITLSEMWRKYNLLFEFKKGMNARGWVGRDVFILESQLQLLKDLIVIESKQMLNEFLMRKSYYRLLKSIDAGIENLPNLLECPEEYVLNQIEKDREAWLDKNDVLVFTCKSGTAAFSKISRKTEGFHYVDGKFQ